MGRHQVGNSNSWRRLFPAIVVALFIGALWLGIGAFPLAVAQEPPDESLEEVEPVTTPAASSSGSSSSSGSEQSLIGMIFSGGIIGIFIVVLIVLLSMVSVALIVEHSMTIRHSTLMPDRVVAELDQMIAGGKINEAIEYCQLPENYSLVSNCVLAGLHRFTTSDYGFAEYRSAVEEEGENQTGRLYRKTEVLGVIGSIAPMLGLTGTVLGMIIAFNTIAATGGMAKPEELAGGIGQALITTLLGLFVAIPSMIAFSFFRNRIDSIVAESGKRIEHLMAPLGRQKKG